MLGLKNLVTALLLVVFAAPAPLQAQNFNVDEIVQARVLTGWRSSNGSHIAGLQLVLGEGWKTYWRAPGEAGIPTQFNWSGSRNLAGVTVEWPTPKAIPQGHFLTIGYDQAVVLPLRVAPRDAGKSIRLAGEVLLGVCRDVCIPVTVSVAQDLPYSAKKRDPKIAAAIADKPYSAAEAGVRKVACRLSPVEGGIKLRTEITMPSVGGYEAVVVEAANPNLWVAQPRSRRLGSKLVAYTTMHHVDDVAFAVNRSELRITVVGEKIAVDIKGCSAG
ncbi:MAG: protein-disulfide reductase DsbD domain-containing protein [Pseudomonadota bacterium]